MAFLYVDWIFVVTMLQEIGSKIDRIAPDHRNHILTRGLPSGD